MLCALGWAGAVHAATRAQTSAGSTGEVILIAEIALLLLVGRGLGEIMQRLGQPSVIGQLLAGIILGPSLFGWLWPGAHHLIFPASTEQKNLIAGISQVGILLLLLLTGMETDLKLVRRVGAPAMAVTAAGVALPFACGFALGEFIPVSLLGSPANRLIASLFLGTALSISSIKIVAMVVREMDFMRRNLGQIIVASAIMEDTIGWVIISVALGFAGGGGVVSAASLLKTVLGTALFLGVSYTIGRRGVFWLIRWVNDTFASEFAVITAILIVMCLFALVTDGLGVNVVLGAFVAGVLVGESPILTGHIEDQLRGFITAFMMPIFFGLSGLSADLTILAQAQYLWLTLVLVAIASIGKFSGAFAGGVASGLSLRESLALGCGMNARGSTEVIVASIGLTMGVLTERLYTIIVTMAVLTTMAMPPMLRWALGRIPMSKEEKERLENEALDARGFVSRLERLLISADTSASGELATRLAGLIAGRRGLPITVLERNGGGAHARSERSLKDAAIEGAKEARTRSAREEGGAPAPQKIEIATRTEAHSDKAVEREAPKGYDMLLIGLEKLADSKGAFSNSVDRTGRGFGGPVTMVGAGGSPNAVLRRKLKVLVPVSGTEASRRGMELAVVIAPAGKGAITALHVADQPSGNKTRRPSRRAVPRGRYESAVLEDAVRLAERYGHDEVDCAVHTDVAPAEAIVAEAARSGANLIVIGASRRVGDRLYLGQTVANVLANWKGAIVLVASN